MLSAETKSSLTLYKVVVLSVQFGKGIYFADMSSKSANYCYATRTKKIGLVLLSEVSVCHVFIAHVKFV